MEIYRDQQIALARSAAILPRSAERHSRRRSTTYQDQQWSLPCHVTDLTKISRSTEQRRTIGCILSSKVCSAVLSHFPSFAEVPRHLQSQKNAQRHINKTQKAKRRERERRHEEKQRGAKR